MALLSVSAILIFITFSNLSVLSPDVRRASTRDSVIKHQWSWKGHTSSLFSWHILCFCITANLSFDLQKFGQTTAFRNLTGIQLFVLFLNEILIWVSKDGFLKEYKEGQTCNSDLKPLNLSSRCCNPFWGFLSTKSVYCTRLIYSGL